MSFPFDHFIEDKNVPPNMLYILNPRYKLVPEGDGSRVLNEVLDVEATAKESVVITNIGAPQKL